MPCDYSRYPKNWKLIRAAILDRAGNRCEKCGAPNLEHIGRSLDAYMLEDGSVFDAETGEPRGVAKGSEFPVRRFVRVVLTVAHLDHTPSNCDPENLRAWCQRCHLAYDLAEHKRHAAETRRKHLENAGQLTLEVDS
jgi:5-methylcytosine-specific restriction endonuclease McrA